jgi:NMD protein affecting ribosome stability and mRNA decay
MEEQTRKLKKENPSCLRCGNEVERPVDHLCVRCDTGAEEKYSRSSDYASYEQELD